ncbi:MAG: heme NO-binding domain-containing protein [Myxococcota bacterium]
MKGIIFNAFEQFVIDSWGEDFLDDVLDRCSLQTQEPFVGPGTYPDEDLLEIVAHTVKALDVPLPQALRAFGRYAFPALASAFPVCVRPHAGARSFLRSVDDVIHVEVRKLHPDASTPAFRYRDDGDALVIEYHSQRSLCHLMEGLIDGVADHFGESIAQRQTRCTADGAPHCEFRLEFATTS